jgi:hypothetical protein
LALADRLDLRLRNFTSHHSARRTKTRLDHRKLSGRNITNNFNTAREGH